MEPAPSTTQHPEGTMLDDKYRIERLLAEGGMGAVYVGSHIKLRKRVAIKVLNPQLTSPMMIERFHREAIMASQIGHEGIVQVTDLGTSTAGEPFLVMEYLEGEALAARLKATGALPIDVACELGCAILSPLAAAHAAGIVHRDLKPDNVFLLKQSRGEMVKLLDFGISRATAGEGEFRLTTTGLILGTPYYMSPEQARGDQAVTYAADVYAFGVMLYEMLVGQVPIRGENYNQLMYRVMTAEYRRPSEVRPDLPPELEQLILSAMALEPEERPPSAAALERALLPFCRPTFRDHMIERISSTALPFRSTNTTARGATPTVADRKKRSWLPIVLGSVAAVGIAIAALVIVQQSSSSDPPPPPPVAEQPAPAVTPPVTPPPPAVQPPPAVVPAPATVTLTFSVEPKSAKITLDGKPVAGSELPIAKDGAEHQLVITASGHEEHRDTIRLDESQRISVQLKKLAAKPSRPARTPKKPNKPDRIDSESPYK
ncbi:MAG TPA: serine/threonine-protein kinase [Kofleriaceae bacterium]